VPLPDVHEARNAEPRMSERRLKRIGVRGNGNL